MFVPSAAKNEKNLYLSCYCQGKGEENCLILFPQNLCKFLFWFFLENQRDGRQKTKGGKYEEVPVPLTLPLGHVRAFWSDAAPSSAGGALGGSLRNRGPSPWSTYGVTRAG